MQSVDAVYQTKMGIKAVALPEMRLDFDSVGKYEKTISLELTLSVLPICWIYITLESQREPTENISNWSNLVGEWTDHLSFNQSRPIRFYYCKLIKQLGNMRLSPVPIG